MENHWEGIGKDWKLKPLRRALFFFSPLAKLAHAIAPMIFFPCSDWLQRGDGSVQEHQVPGLGSWRADVDPSVLAVLLPEHAGDHLRGGFDGRGAVGDDQGGVPHHPRRGRTQGRHGARLCKQARPPGITRRSKVRHPHEQHPHHDARVDCNNNIHEGIGDGANVDCIALACSDMLCTHVWWTGLPRSLSCTR